MKTWIVLLIVVTVLAIWLSVFLLIRREHYSQKSPTVAVLIISAVKSNNHSRWKNEKILWQTEMDSLPNNIDVYFLESDPSMKEGTGKLDGDDLLCGCTDSYQPGIFQKTIIAMKTLPKYDFYVRTTLASYINGAALLESIKKFKPNHNGAPFAPRGMKDDRRDELDAAVEKHGLPAFEENWLWVSGYGMLMGRETVDHLLLYSNIPELYTSNIPDDVLIGLITHPSDPSGAQYVWNPDETYDQNIAKIKSMKTLPWLYRLRYEELDLLSERKRLSKELG